MHAGLCSLRHVAQNGILASANCKPTTHKNLHRSVEYVYNIATYNTLLQIVSKESFRAVPRDRQHQLFD